MSIQVPLPYIYLSQSPTLSFPRILTMPFTTTCESSFVLSPSHFFIHTIEWQFHCLKFCSLIGFLLTIVFPGHPMSACTPHVKPTRSWTKFRFFPPLLIGHNQLSRDPQGSIDVNQGATMVDGMCVWATNSCRLLLSFTPACGWSWVYLFHFIMNYFWACLPLGLRNSDRTQLIMNGFACVVTCPVARCHLS